jgi:hypothetical protein
LALDQEIDVTLNLKNVLRWNYQLLVIWIEVCFDLLFVILGLVDDKWHLELLLLIFFWVGHVFVQYFVETSHVFHFFTKHLLLFSVNVRCFFYLLCIKFFQFFHFIDFGS